MSDDPLTRACEMLVLSQGIIDSKNAEIARLTAEVERHRMTDEERAALLGVAFTPCRSLSQWAVVEDYLARTATREEE